MRCDRTDEVLALLDEDRLTEAARLAGHPEACDVCVRAVTAAMMQQSGHGSAPSEDAVALHAVGLATSAEEVAAGLALGDEAAEVLGPALATVAEVSVPSLVLAEPPERRRSRPSPAALASLASLVAGLGVFVLWDTDESPTPAEPPEVAAPAVAPVGEPTSPEVATPAEVAAPPPPSEAAPPPAPAAAAPTKPAASRARSTKPKRRSRRRSRADDELDELLGNTKRRRPSRGAARSPRPAPAGASALPVRLGRAQILAVVTRGSPAIRACKKEQAGFSGTVTVRLKIARTGRVEGAQVLTAGLAGSAVGRCVAGRVRALRFPRFSGKAMQITLPFGL